MPSWGDGLKARSSGGPEGLPSQRGDSSPAEPCADPPVVLTPGQELFRLDEACKLTGLQPAAIRRRAQEFPDVAPTPASNNQLFLTRRQVLLLAEAQLPDAAGHLTRFEGLQEAQAPAELRSATRDAMPAVLIRAKDPAPRRGRAPWEDTEVMKLVEERLQPIYDL